MRIIVFGATGKTGQSFVRQALDEGHKITAFVRNPDKIIIKNQGLKIVVGSALDRVVVSDAINGHDAVVSCLGSDAGRAKSVFLTRMTDNIVEGMKNNDIKRIVYMSSAGIYKEIPGLTGKIVLYMLRNQLEDHKNATDIIINSNLDYTIARPMGLIDGPKTKAYRKTIVGVPKGGLEITREDVASFLLQSLTNNEHINETVGLAY